MKVKEYNILSQTISTMSENSSDIKTMSCIVTNGYRVIKINNYTYTLYTCNSMLV